MAKAKSAISLGISALIVIVLILIVGFGLFLNATFNTSSTTNTSNTIGTTSISSTTVSVQNVSLSDYNAPAVQGTTQSNGTVLYIPPTVEGNLGFHVIMPLAMASAPPDISIYLNGQSITSCSGVTIVPTGQTVEEGIGCGAPVTPVGSSNNVTILVSSPLISVLYRYQSFVVTTSVSSSGSSSSTSSADTTVCSISGQPAGFFLRILSDSTLKPLIGAQVMATNQPAFCGNIPATGQEKVIFVTGNTEWYPFSGENNVGYSFIISYSGQNYTFKASLSPVSVTCATLLIPSGRTNLTITEFQTSCGGALAGMNRVTFIQQGACQPAYYVAPWSVTLGNQTIVEPSNATLPIPNNQFQASTANIVYAQIVFFVPSGIYNYSMSPNLMVGHSSGTILVNGSDVTVQVGPAPFSAP